ncbi:MAG: hypothetical protein R3A44_09355 [Caldilineaceae bacterium]
MHQTNKTPIWLICIAGLTIMIMSACRTNQSPDTAPVALSPTAENSSPTSTARAVIALTATPTLDPESHLAVASAPDLSAVPLLATRQAQVDAALQADPPVLLLDDAELDAEQQRAQRLALQSADFLRYAYAPNDRTPLRNEMFAVYPARESDITPATTACAEHACYRVEMYNHALNITSIAMVDLDVSDDASAVMEVTHLPEAQPEAPAHLAALAQQIAMQSPEVQAALGFAPTDATMSNAKTALNHTTCESSRHFCVAPTFLVDDRALWAIVDLTEGRLVGVRWTYLGDFSAGRPDEVMIQREEIYNRFCQQNTRLEKDGWTFDYILTSSDGLRVSDVRFNDAPVVDSIKLVDWHVSYSWQEGFGYSDGIGCPIFSTSAVEAAALPTVEDIVQEGEVVGFALVQDYRHTQWPLPCNYRYMQRYEFYGDGSFRPVMLNLGRGCGNQGTYRPILRLDLVDDQKLSAWDGADWQTWDAEGWELLDENMPFTDDGYRYRLQDAAGAGYYVEPGRGQFDDGGRGDTPYVYVTHHNSAEGDADLITLGACCNTDYQQGPEVFIDEQPESTTDGDLVLWYVAQLHNDDTPGQQYCWADRAVEAGVLEPVIWPCAGGPRFVPVGEKK